MTDNQIAQRILDLAKQRGLKRSQLPDLTGVSKIRLDNLFKRPGAKPNAEDLWCLAQGLETTEAYLLFGGEPPSQREALESALIDLSRHLPDAELRALVIGLRLRLVHDAKEGEGEP